MSIAAHTIRHYFMSVVLQTLWERIFETLPILRVHQNVKVYQKYMIFFTIRRNIYHLYGVYINMNSIENSYIKFRYFWTRAYLSVVPHGHSSNCDTCIEEIWRRWYKHWLPISCFIPLLTSPLQNITQICFGNLTRPVRSCPNEIYPNAYKPGCVEKYTRIYGLFFMFWACTSRSNVLNHRWSCW